MNTPSESTRTKLPPARNLPWGVFLVPSDLTAFLVLWLCAWYARFLWGGYAGRPINEIDSYLQALPVLLPLWIALTAYGRHYQVQNRIESLNRFGAIIGTTLLFWVATMAAAYVFRSWSLGRSVIALGALMMGLWLWISRSLVRELKRRRTEQGRDRVRVAIVGCGEAGRMTAEHLGDHSDIAYDLAGYITLGDEVPPGAIDGVPVLGSSRDLEELIHAHGLDEVAIAEPSLSAGESLALVDACERARVDFRLVTRDFLHVIHNWLKVDEVGEYSVMLIPNDPLPPLSAALKRAMDLIVAVPGALLALPLGLLIAALIRIDSRGPVFFVHERVGREGGRFRIFKFRTMVENADPYAPAPENSADPRITRVGHWLRRTSLDELPQLWNVIRGDMSLVGPRPEMPFVVEKYQPWQRRRLDVPQGITGLWQIAGRKRLPLHNNMEYDFYYIRNRSLFLDCAILLRTVAAVLFGRGAF